jgi:hypothetical protein
MLHGRCPARNRGNSYPLFLLWGLLGTLLLFTLSLFFLFHFSGKFLLALLIAVIRFPGHPMLLSDGYSISSMEENRRQISRLDIVRKKEPHEKPRGSLQLNAKSY